MRSTSTRAILGGFVGTVADQRKALELARKVPGVKSVKDDMRLK